MRSHLESIYHGVKTILIPHADDHDPQKPRMSHRVSRPTGSDLYIRYIVHRYLLIRRCLCAAAERRHFVSSVVKASNPPTFLRRRPTKSCFLVGANGGPADLSVDPVAVDLRASACFK